MEKFLKQYFANVIKTDDENDIDNNYLIIFENDFNYVYFGRPTTIYLIMKTDKISRNLSEKIKKNVSTSILLYHPDSDSD